MKALKAFSFFSCVLVFSTVLSLTANAAKRGTPVTIQKAKGQSAIVLFPKGTVPKAGAKYTLSTGDDGMGEDEGGDGEMGDGSNLSRENTIALSLDVSKASGTSLAMSLALDYGWNMGSFEVGPSVLFAKAGVTTFGGGVFADINFIENKGPETFIPAVGIRALFVKTGAVAPATGSTSIPVKGALVGKIFLLKNSVALRVAPYFEFTKVTGGSTKSFGLDGGLQVYF